MPMSYPQLPIGLSIVELSWFLQLKSVSQTVKREICLESHLCKQLK